MTILYLSPVGSMGGAEQCLLNVITAVRAARPEFELHLIAGSEGPLLGRAAAAGVNVRLLPLPAQLANLGDSILARNNGLRQFAHMAAAAALGLPAIHRYLRALRRQILDIRPRVIHSNGLKTHLLTSLLPIGRPRVVWHVHDFLGVRPAMSRVLRWASPRCATAIAVSEAVANDVRLILPQTPVNLVYNAIDLGHFTNGAALRLSGGSAPVTLEPQTPVANLDAMAHLPIAPAGTLRIGLVATFARWKGQDVFIEVAARYLREYPDAKVRFYLVGGPIYHTRGSQFSEQELHRHAGHLGLGSRIGFIGFQADTRAIYRALNIVVHASTKPEPFGLTIAEAMACGRPVIVSQNGGAIELFTHDFDAVGVPPGDVAALVSAIAGLVADPARRQALGRNAIETALKRFSRDRMGKQIIEIYESVLSGIKRTRSPTVI